MKGLVRRKIPLVLLSLLIMIVVARLALPYALKAYINKTLDEIPGYYGHIEDVDVALWRGAYRMEGVKLLKTKADSSQPFFAADTVSISLDWKSIFRGRLVTKIALYSPQMNFINRESKATSQTSVDESWQSQVQKLYPFQINKFAIHNGFIRYKDETSDPKINLYAKKLNLNADNISNTLKDEGRLPSSVDFKGQLLNSATMEAKAKFSILSEPTELDFNGSISGLELKELNNFAKAYGNFDFEKGRFDAAAELAANKSRWNGYVKTVLTGVDILDWSKEEKKGDSIGHLLWEGMAGSIVDVFENQKRDKFAARIPISGSRKEIQINSWATIGSILKNAFIKVISPDLEDSVEFNASRSSSTEKVNEKDPADEKNEKN